MWLTRPNPNTSPFLFKGAPQTLYYDLTAPKFIGDGSSLTNVNAAKVNNHTVNKDVPTDAVFTDTTYSDATQSAAGLMSAADKAKLDGIDVGANKLPDVFTTHNGKTLLVSGGKWVVADGTYISKLNANNLNSGTVPSTRLPIADSTTAGAVKVGARLSISNGVLSADNQLPTVTTSDNGKFLQVVNGEWAAVEYAAAEGVEF